MNFRRLRPAIRPARQSPQAEDLCGQRFTVNTLMVIGVDWQTRFANNLPEVGSGQHNHVMEDRRFRVERWSSALHHATTSRHIEHLAATTDAKTGISVCNTACPK